jgi:hypothetical protein
MRRIAPFAPARETPNPLALARISSVVGVGATRRGRPASVVSEDVPSSAIARFRLAPDASAGNSSSSAIDNLLVVFPCLHATSTDFVVAASPPSLGVVPLGGFPILALARSSAATLSRTTDVASLAQVSVARARDARARRPDDDSSSRRESCIVARISDAADVDVVVSTHARATRDASIASTSMTFARDARRVRARVRRRSIAMRVVGLFLHFFRRRPSRRARSNDVSRVV